MRRRRPDPASAQDGKRRHERALRGQRACVHSQTRSALCHSLYQTRIQIQGSVPHCEPQGAALHWVCNIWASLLGAVQACTQQPVSQPSVLNEGVNHGVGGRRDRQPSLSTVRSAPLGTGAAEVMGTSTDGTGFSLARSVILAAKKMNYLHDMGA